MLHQRRRAKILAPSPVAVFMASPGFLEKQRDKKRVCCLCSLQGQPANISHTAIVGVGGMVVPVPAIRVAGISWGREKKGKKGKI